MFRPRRPLEQSRILVTGASSGIGRALAEELAGLQTRLLLTARRQDRLQELAERLREHGVQQVMTLAGDITDAGHREQLRATAEETFGGLDILINNAGVGGIGSFASADEDRLRQIMEVNFFAPVELIRTLLPSLKKSEDGVIVNVGSVLGHCAVPKKSEYCASKFALHGISDALRMELRESHIDLLLVSPSTTKSEFFDQALRSHGDAAVNRFAMSPQQVARAIVKSIRVRRRETILSFGGKLLVYTNRLMPSIVSHLLGRFA